MRRPTNRHRRRAATIIAITGTAIVWALYGYVTTVTPTLEADPVTETTTPTPKALTQQHLTTLSSTDTTTITPDGPR